MSDYNATEAAVYETALLHRIVNPDLNWIGLLDLTLDDLALRGWEVGPPEFHVMARRQVEAVIRDHT